MGHAGTKQEFQPSNAATVQSQASHYVSTEPTPGWPIAAKTGRTLPPPPPLAATQTRSGIAPKAPTLPKTGSVHPPSLAPKSADELRTKLERAKRSSFRPPSLPRDVEALPIVPQWEENATPLKPTNKNRAPLWLRIAGAGLAAGLLVSAGYMCAQRQLLPQAALSWLDVGGQQTSAPRALALPLMAAAPKGATTVLTSTAPAQSPMVAATLANAVAAAAPAAKDELKSEADVHAAKLAVKAGAKTRSPRTLRSKTKTAALQAAAAQEEDSADADDDNDNDNETEQAAAPVVARKAPTEKLPEQPSRADVQKGLEGVRAFLATCAAGQHGTTYANVTIAGTGHVSYSTVEGTFAGSAAGSCMARALRSGDFPRFSGSPVKVRYPFVF